MILLSLECPFCKVSISTVDEESVASSKRFMGFHLAMNHHSEVERVLYRLHDRTYKPAPSKGKTKGFKRGL